LDSEPVKALEEEKNKIFQI